MIRTLFLSRGLVKKEGEQVVERVSLVFFGVGTRLMVQKRSRHHEESFGEDIF
jgi:hypothetical protein